MKKNERLRALQCLKRIIIQKNTLSAVLQNDKTITPFTKTICYGVCRHSIRLESLANLLAKKRPQDDDVWICLLMGLYELHFLKTPDYAVVKETVALLDQLKKTWAKGFINAILRRYCREQTVLLESLATKPEFLYGHPHWLLKRLQKDWPLNWQSIVTANDKHPPMTIRVNPHYQSREIYLEILKNAGIEATLHMYAPNAITLTTPLDVYALPGFSEGHCSVQDAAAQMAVSLLNITPDLRVLDACCAPGGKLGHLLENSPQPKTLVGLDCDAKRLQRVEENLQRLKQSAKLVTGDASNPDAWWDGVKFDRILLDAPCSALGVIRRHPDLKLLRTEAEITQAANLQKKILHALWPLLTENGLLLYATCSILPEENDLQIQSFLAQHQDAQIIPLNFPWGQVTNHGLQIFPDLMDGFFYSLIKKVSS